MTESEQDANLEKASLEDYIRQHGSLGINLQDIGFSGKIESPEERDARLKREEDTHRTQQQLTLWKFFVKEAAVYVVALLLVLGISGISIFTLYNSQASSNNKDWAKTTLAALSSALAGYLFGKSNSTKE